MSDSAILLKPVNDLLTERFHVPAYQRGYRWTKRQVDDLLNDLWDFQDKATSKEAFYCLQPVVVKKSDDGAWEVVDGQQRLTTIFLILTALKLFLAEMGKEPFSLSFETRKGSEGFLRDLDPALRGKNIDYHHISNAYDAIRDWFKNNDGSRRLKILQCLTNDNATGRNVKVIWYELPNGDPIDAFTRLNMGKIPLTNSELIRALFLQSANFEISAGSHIQLRIAQEWDGIEKTLRRDEVWYFLHQQKDEPANRIEYLFELIAETAVGDDKDELRTFRFYHERFAKGPGIAEHEWLAVKRVFMTLEEWFNDRVLYHLVGYLVATGDDIATLMRAGERVAKSEFHQVLKRMIFQRLTGELLAEISQTHATIIEFLDGLDYDKSPKEIRHTLLLFNIATLLKNEDSNLRFPFDAFKKDQWDIEHVRSIDSGKPDNSPEQKAWLEQSAKCLDAVEDAGLLGKVRATISSARCDGFDACYNQLLERFDERVTRETDHGISNLALLDAGTNRSYKNAVFPVKRGVILDRDRDGTFVPLCTKNVFLKCYSKNVGRMMFWSPSDSADYLAALVDILTGFFAKVDGGNV